MTYKSARAAIAPRITVYEAMLRERRELVAALKEMEAWGTKMCRVPRHDSPLAKARKLIARYDDTATTRAPTARKGCIYPEMPDCPKLRHEDDAGGSTFYCSTCDFSAKTSNPEERSNG